MSEGHISSYEKLKSRQSLAEILELSISFEKTARDFYTDLVPKVSKQIRYLVEELAEEEQGHYDLFSELKARSDLDEQIKELVQTPASNARFTECTHLPDLGENPDDQTILQYAIGREKAAMEQYQSLSDSTDEGPIKDLFTFLAKEEAEHKVELEKIYEEILDSSGV